MSRIIHLKEETMDYDVISQEEAVEASGQISRILDNIEIVIHGKRDKVALTFLCLLAGGHVLIEDIPGVGKTSMVRALAKTIDCGFSRIQFTPDVMPSDISGFSVYNQKTGEFEFRPGAAMSNIVLADEINRASAKTQSAMLEIMEERQVTVDSRTYQMQEPFMVLATQNPIDSLGTYRLPEAQIDRFMMKLSLGYPDHGDEVDVVMYGKKQKRSIQPVISAQGVKDLIDQCSRVRVERILADYMVHIVEATRRNPDIRLGASPRGSIALYDASKARALMQGRNYVLPDDVKYLAPFVLSHRIRLTHTARTEQKKPEEIVNNIVSGIMVP